MRKSFHKAITITTKRFRKPSKQGDTMDRLSISDGPFDEAEFRSKIPKEASQSERTYYERLIPVLKARKPSDRPRIVIITDIEQDYDDLMAIVFLSEMHRLGVVELAGFVANHQPALERARFLRSIIYLLGLGHLEVAVGTRGVLNPDKPENARFVQGSYYELKNETFDQMIWNTKPHRQGLKPSRTPAQILSDLENQVDPPGAEPFRPGQELLDDLTKQVDVEGKEPLTVLLISSLQDISEYFDAHKNDDASVFQKHFKKFVSQGGYIVDKAAKTFKLDPNFGMANNSYHRTAAENYVKCLVKYNLPSDAWSREAAKAAKLESKTLGNLVDHGPIGTHLSWLYRRQEFKFYWDPYHAPYMPRLDRVWYAKTRLCLDPSSPEYATFTKGPMPEFQDVLPYAKVIAYDGCAAMGAVGDDVMIALGIMNPDAVPDYNKAAHRHRIFGRGLGADGKEDPSDLGGIDGPKLADAFEVFFYGALRATKEFAGQLIDPKAVRHRMADPESLIPLVVFDKQTALINIAKQMEEDNVKPKRNALNAMQEVKKKNQAAWTAEDEKKREILEEEVKAEEEKVDRYKREPLKEIVGGEETERPLKMKLGGVEKEFPRVPEPKDYPYQLLYERAVKGHAPVKSAGD